MSHPRDLTVTLASSRQEGPLLLTCDLGGEQAWVTHPQWESRTSFLPGLVSEDNHCLVPNLHTRGKQALDTC